MDVHGLIRDIQAPDQRNVGMVEHSEIGVPNLDKLATLDRAAVGVMSWSLLSIPGLLRTADYASTAIVAAQPYLPPYEVERRTRKQSRRSVAFEDRLAAEAERAPGDGLALTRAHFIIGERALRDPLAGSGRGDARVHRVQLECVLALIDRWPDTVRVQVWPDHLAAPGLDDHCLLWELPAFEGEGDGGPVNHLVGYVETVLGAFYSTRYAYLSRAFDAFTAMMNRAMRPDESRKFIEDVVAWSSSTG